MTNDRFETILSRERTLNRAVVAVLSVLFLLSAALVLAAW